LELTLVGVRMMSTNLLHRAVGTFADRNTVESALMRLKNANTNMSNVSVVVKSEENYPDQIAGVGVTDTLGNHAGEGASTGAITGAAIGGVAGLLIGIGALAIPGIGPVMTAGALTTALATSASGGAIGAATGGLGGALAGLGIPEGRAEEYSEIVRQGGYLIMVDGSEEEVRSAQAILGQNFSTYSASSPTFVDRATNFEGDTVEQRVTTQIPGETHDLK
jgi:hypothetical protein